MLVLVVVVLGACELDASCQRSGRSGYADSCVGDSCGVLVLVVAVVVVLVLGACQPGACCRRCGLSVYAFSHVSDNCGVPVPVVAVLVMVRAMENNASVDRFLACGKVTCKHQSVALSSVDSGALHV